ncbi:unnamed protein product [Ixodes hexagonus]
MPDSRSDSSSISRATDVDGDWEDLAGDHPAAMMNEVSTTVNQLVERATSQLKGSTVYRTFLRDSPVLSTCLAIGVGVLSLPALTFASFIIVLCLLTFLGFLFVEGTLITFGVIVTGGILVFVGTFLVSLGCCLYAAFYVLQKLGLISDPEAEADASKKRE